MAEARIWACAALARATGTRHFMALCAGIRPATTSRCTGSGRTRIRSNRRATQFLERPSRCAMVSRSTPSPSTSSWISRACSRADRGEAIWPIRTHRSASAARRFRTCARTTSCPSRLSPATRRCPSMTRYSSRLSPGTTVIGNSWPLSSSEASKPRSHRRSRIRRRAYGVFRNRSSSATISPATSASLLLQEETDGYGLQRIRAGLPLAQEPCHPLPGPKKELVAPLRR